MKLTITVSSLPEARARMNKQMLSETTSLISEGYRYDSTANLLGGVVIHRFKHKRNGNRMSIAVGTNYVQITKNQKTLKRYEYKMHQL